MIKCARVSFVSIASIKRTNNARLNLDMVFDAVFPVEMGSPVDTVFMIGGNRWEGQKVKGMEK